jgi:uncharacterized membrane protein
LLIPVILVGSVLIAAGRRQYVEEWRVFAAATSNVPFVAIIFGRQHLSVREIGPWPIAAGLGVFVITLAFDTLLSSASLFANARIAFR